MPDPRPVKLTVLLRPELMAALRRRAATEQRTMTKVVERALEREIERAGTEPAQARKRAS